MSNITFTRIDAKGPGATGLNPALHDPADVILDGAKAPHALNAYSDATNMLSAGVWQCDAGTLKLADLPIHEVCVLIEGEVVITSDDGRSEHYAAGDAFILHKGFSARGICRSRPRNTASCTAADSPAAPRHCFTETLP